MKLMNEVAELKAGFEDSRSFIFADYRGLTREVLGLTTDEPVDDSGQSAPVVESVESALL